MKTIQSISAVTLTTRDMAQSVSFYRTLGFKIRYGGENARFTSFYVGEGYLNLTLTTDPLPSFWGRVIFFTSDVDALYSHAIDKGLQPDFPPRDATWGERYFHIKDPDGHELSFAKPL